MLAVAPQMCRPWYGISWVSTSYTGDAARARQVVARIEHELERHLEGVLDFRAVESQVEAGAHEADDRRHAEARDHQVIAQVAGALDEARLEADLLARLAQRRRPRIGVARLDASARETDLPGVVRQVRGALRQQHVQAFGPLDQRHQHRGTRRVRPETGPQPRALFVR